MAAGHGWLWIPGSDWGPAWVSWRSGEGYYGWAPLGPGYDLANGGDYSCPNDWWVFIPPQYIYTGNYYRYWYGPHSNSDIIHHTDFIKNNYVNNHVTYVLGPRSHDVEQITHKPVQVYHITNSTNLTTHVHSTDIKMYRPAEIRPASGINGTRPVPPNVVGAPQPVKNSQAVNAGQTTPPQFRNKLPNTAPVVPGTTYNKTAEPNTRPVRNDNNPYEWDVKKAEQQQQQQRQQNAPQQVPEPARQQNRPEPQRTEPPRQAPEPQRQNPAPAPQPRPAPAPAPARQEPGGRR